MNEKNFKVLKPMETFVDPHKFDGIPVYTLNFQTKKFDSNVTRPKLCVNEIIDLLYFYGNSYSAMGFYS